MDKPHRLLLIITILNGLLALQVSAQTTNIIPSNLFLTDDGKLFWYRSHGEKVVATQKITEAQTSAECQLAAQDPKGNWGDVVEGFQLSLRFEKQTYAPGEPVAANVFLRNVSDKTLDYSKASVVGHPSPVDVSVSKDHKPLALKNNPEVIKVISARTESIFPQTQHKFGIELSKFYDLTMPGEYSIQAKHHVPKLDGTGRKELLSGTVSVLIANSPTGTNTPAR